MAILLAEFFISTMYVAVFGMVMSVMVVWCMFVLTILLYLLLHLLCGKLCGWGWGGALVFVVGEVVIA